jgi:hypothetical protein
MRSAAFAAFVVQAHDAPPLGGCCDSWFRNTLGRDYRKRLRKRLRLGRFARRKRSHLSPPPGLNGHEIMSALDQSLTDNPGMAERPYDEATAATLSRHFRCQAL